MSRSVRNLVVVSAVLVSLALTACGQGAPSSPAASPLPSDPRQEVESEASPLPTAIVGLPVDRRCDQILTPEDLYAYNPNFVTDPDFRASSLAEQVVSLEGIACGWINQTSGVTLSIAVARFDDANRDDVRAAASEKPGASALSTADGFFRAPSGTGIVEAFIAQHWVVIESPAISVEGDAVSLLQMLDASLQ